MKRTIAGLSLSAALALGVAEANASTIILDKTGTGTGFGFVGYDINSLGGNYRVDLYLSKAFYFEIESQYQYAHREYDINDNYNEINGNETIIVSNDGWISNRATFYFNILPYTSEIRYGSIEDVHFPFDTFVVARFWPDLQSDTYSYRIRVVDLAAVPEPATWALMLVGFASMGSALRRRQNLAV
jgi:hypothetical protein